MVVRRLVPFGGMSVQYRRFGSLDWRVSALGFGAMRLPVIGGDRGQIDAANL